MSDEFDFYQNLDSGQLWLEDRQAIWAAVRDLKPRIAVETGTWRGGGSTFLIASALHRNGSGMLHSVESYRPMYDEAVRHYETDWPHLAPYVDLHFGNSVDVYREVLEAKILDFVFLDGADGAENIELEFALLGPKVRSGGILMSHDFYNGKELASILKHPDWTDIHIIGNGHGTFEEGSVGLLSARKR